MKPPSGEAGGSKRPFFAALGVCCCARKHLDGEYRDAGTQPGGHEGLRRDIIKIFSAFSPPPVCLQLQRLQRFGFVSCLRLIGSQLREHLRVKTWMLTHYSRHPPFYLLYSIVKKAVKAFGSSSVPPQDTTAPPLTESGVTAARRARQERFEEFRSCSGNKSLLSTPYFSLPSSGLLWNQSRKTEHGSASWMTWVKSVGCHSADSDDDEEQEKKKKKKKHNGKKTFPCKVD